MRAVWNASSHAMSVYGFVPVSAVSVFVMKGFSALSDLIYWEFCTERCVRMCRCTTADCCHYQISFSINHLAYNIPEDYDECPLQGPKDQSDISVAGCFLWSLLQKLRICSSFFKTLCANFKITSSKKSLIIM